MRQALRYLCFCLAVIGFATARAEAATVTLAWDPNSETDLARYLVGYRTSPNGTETIVSVGLVTTWSLTTAVAGQTYYFRVYAENTAGLRSAPSNEVSTTVPTTPPPPTGGGLALDRGRLSFGATKTGSTVNQVTPSQRLLVTRTSSSSVSWSASASNSWIRVTPSSGSNTGSVTVSLQASGLNPGTYNGSVTIRPTGTSTNLVVQVQARVYANGATSGPSGVIDTPTDGVTNVTGAIPVTGWAVDDVGVERVDVYRDPVGSENPNIPVFLGSAAFVSGSRTDIENAYPNSPLNYRGGWGFMVLTNMLPDLANGRATGGNGTFRLHAYAVDYEGIASYLGTKRFSANNRNATRPFGSIDTPAQGGTASGSSYMVFGWAISPRSSIPTNGSTITVYVDGNPVGHPTYNQYRSDIASMFPGYANSNGAVGFLPLNTTQLSNGTHTISWVVTDSQGNSEGIGSRYFTVQNGTTGALTEAVESSTVAEGTHGSEVGQAAETVAALQPDYALVEVKKVASEDPTPELVFPESSGMVHVKAVEAEQIEVQLANQFDDAGGVYDGYVVVEGSLRPLPVGSTLDRTRGIYKWQPGPGFIGSYEFVFVRKVKGGSRTRIPVTITIRPKFEDRQSGFNER